MNPKTDNQYARAARLKKVNALVKMFDASCLDHKDMSEKDWEAAAGVAKVNLPSMETRLAVIQRLENEARGIAYCTCGRIGTACPAFGDDPALEHMDR